jgi:hypothetical protein
MSEHTTRRRRLLATSTVVVGAGLAAAGVASAASGAPATTTSVAPGEAACSGPMASAHGPRGLMLTGDDLAKATTAAEAAVRGATVLRADTDPAGAYVLHMKRADGTFVTVKLDASFKVTGVEDGLAAGAPGVPPGPLGPPGALS